MKNLTKVLVLVLTGIWLLAFPNPAAAIPIVYRVSANASGTIGNIPFSNVLVTVSLVGDTSRVQPIEDNPFFVAQPGNTFIDITGFGQAGATEFIGVFSSGIPIELPYEIIDEDFPVLPYVVIGTIDVPPFLNSHTPIAIVGSSLLTGYDLTTSIGPITASPGGIGYPPGYVIRTSRGNLTFAANPAPITTGTFVATTVPPVPEPFSILSLCAGGLALILFRYAHHARASKKLRVQSPPKCTEWAASVLDHFAAMLTGTLLPFN